MTRACYPLALLLWPMALAVRPAQAESKATDQPAIAKDSVRVTASRVAGVWKNGKQGPGVSWLPAIEFRINGPIPSESHYSVDFTLPGNKPWTTFNCPDPTVEVQQGWSWKTACGALEMNRDESVKDNKAVAATGTFGFTIRVRNELAGTKATLFTGKIKVGKFTPSPKAPQEVEYYVDEDWRIPIGYIGFEGSPAKQMPGSSYQGNDSDVLLAAMEFRGKPGEIKGHIFYQGKELADTTCTAGLDSEFDPAKYIWSEQECKFSGVYLNEPTGGGDAPMHVITKSPGDYEIKVLAGGHTARTIKFAVSADGKLDFGVSAANKLGSGRAIVPVQVIGNQGPWDKAAWKTAAFYGNPLTGFKAP